MYDFDYGSKIMEATSREAQERLLQQLKFLTDRGLLVIKQEQPVISRTQDGEYKLTAAIELTVPQEEYILELENKLARAEADIKYLGKVISNLGYTPPDLTESVEEEEEDDV